MLEGLDQDLIYEIRHRIGLTNPRKIARAIILSIDDSDFSVDKINRTMINLHDYNSKLHRFRVWE